MSQLSIFTRVQRLRVQGYTSLQVSHSLKLPLATVNDNWAPKDKEFKPFDFLEEDGVSMAREI